MLLLPIGLMAPSAVPAAGQPQSGSPGLLLDGIATVGAYSVRKLVSAYAGPALRVRRDSDGTEQDIGFVSGALDSVAMLAFCGAGSGFASKWYDQSGAGHDAVQPTAAEQYRVVSTGALVTQGGHPPGGASARACLGYGGGAITMALPGGMFAALASSTALCVFSQAQADAGWWIIGSSGLFTHTPYGDGAAYEQYLSTSRPGFPGYGSSSAPTVHAAQNDGTALSVFKNGVQAGSAQTAAFTNAPSATQGDYRHGQVNLSEMILTAAVLPAADRQAVERSMGAYYGITVA